MRPSVGTWCLICLAAGHKCQSQICVSGDPLCLPCADGDPCSFVRVAIKAQLSKPDVFDVIIPMRAKESTILKAILPSSAAREGADARNSARMRAALGPKVSEVLIEQAHDDIKSGRHLERKPRAQKTPAVAPIEKQQPSPQLKAKNPATVPKRKPKEEVKTYMPITISPEIAQKIRDEWTTGTTIASVQRKYGISWYEASSFKPKAISAKLGESPAPKPKPVAETPGTMKEVFDEVFPAKPESWVGRTTQEVRDSCGHWHTDNDKCFDCGLVFPRSEQVNVPNPPAVTKLTDEPPVGSEKWRDKTAQEIHADMQEMFSTLPSAPYKTIKDMLETTEERVFVTFEFGDAEATRIFSNLSAANKAEALRSVLSGLLWTS